METKDFMEVVARHCGVELSIPEEFTVDFHGAKNKNGETTYTAKDKNEISVLYGFDKIFKAEKLSGIALCMAFAKIDSLGYKAGFESSKEFLKAVTELDIKTINSRINVGRTLFDLNGQPVVHNLLDYDWSKALEMVTIKKNDTNSEKAGLEQLNAYIDNGYITPNTSLARLKSWKNLLALGYIPEEWVTETVSETGEKGYSWNECDGEHMSKFPPYPEKNSEDDRKLNGGKKSDDKKPEDKKPEDGKTEDGKTEDGKAEEKKPEEAYDPMKGLDAFTTLSELYFNDNKIVFDDADRKMYIKSIKTLKALIEKYKK